MSIFANIKTAITAVLGGIAVIFYVLFNIQKSKTTTAKTKADKAESDTKALAEVNQSNNEVVEKKLTVDQIVHDANDKIAELKVNNAKVEELEKKKSFRFGSYE